MEAGGAPNFSQMRGKLLREKQLAGRGGSAVESIGVNGGREGQLRVA